VIQASGSPGNLQADMNEDASIDGQRRLILDFGAANTQADLNATAYPFGPSTTLELDTYIATLGENFSNTDPSLMTMPASPAAGSVVNKRMRIAWVTGNIRYHLRWDNAPGRSFIAFTCQVSTGSACSAWTAEPALGSKAGLYGTPIKGKPSEVHYGDFRMPFSIELERQ
jgi:hypothetical protein